MNQEETGFRQFCQELPTVSLVLDEDLKIRDINHFGCQQLGFERNQLLGMPFTKLCLAEEQNYVRNNLLQCLKEAPCLKRWECGHNRNDGTTYWARDTVRVIRDGNGRVVILIASEDITETRYLISELERKSSIDELTGLFNRRRFNLYLEELLLSAQSESQSHVLLFIDLDQFKAVNDACGHLGGDQLLGEVASLLRQGIRSQDILARLGGDEFGLLLRSCSIEEARRIATKLIRTLNHFRFTWDGECFSIGASIGGALIEPRSGLKGKDVLKQADSACYLAKEKGRNRVEMYEPGNKLLERRGSMQNWYNRIQQALDRSFFTLYTQKLAPINSRVAGTLAREVLIRLRDESGKVIPPGAFMPAAEYYDLTPRIDRWVIEEVVRHFRTLPEPDGGIYFVNLSGLTLSDPEYIDAVSKLLPAYLDEGLKICFEITESVAIRHLESARQFIDRFKGLGCQFALDDFGSGFSSFGYLKALPIDIIKIDGEFVRNIVHDAADQAVVMAIHAVATALGKQTVAEHVEDERALNMLRGMAIDYAQGYHIEKPHPLFGGPA